MRTRLSTTWAVWLTFCVAVANWSIARAAEPAADEAAKPAANSSESAAALESVETIAELIEQYSALKKQHLADREELKRQRAELGEEYRGKLTELLREWLPVVRAAGKRTKELLKEIPQDPAYVDGILFVVTDLNAPLNDEMAQVLIDHHLARPEMGAVCIKLLRYSRLPAVKRLITLVAENSPSHDAQGQAVFALAKVYMDAVEARVPKLTDEEKSDLAAKSRIQFQKVIDDFADVALPGSKAKLGDRATKELIRLDNMEKLVVGKPAPDFSGTTLDGKEIKLSDFDGKVRVVVFWGSWCGPCMAAVPHERELVERMKDKPFVMIGINGGDTLEKAKATAEEKQITWPCIWDQGATDGPVQTAYNVRAWPTLYVIDHDGAIQKVMRGLNAKELDKTVEELVEKAEQAKTEEASTES